MAYLVSQGITVTLGGSTVANVTQVTINESSNQLDTSDIALASNSARTFINGLKEAAEVTINSFGSEIATGDKPGGLQVGSFSFNGATVMSSEVSYRVGELIGYTTSLKAST
jgi:hypothetical protein